MALRFCRNRRKGYAFKNEAEALQTAAARYKLSVGREVKTEIPIKPIPIDMHQILREESICKPLSYPL